MTESQSVGRPAKSASQLSKQAILQTALPIVQEQGADALTFRLLAEALKVTPMAVKYHAGSKSDLLADLVELGFRGTLDGVEGVDAKPRARAILRAYYERAVVNANLLRAVLDDVGLMSDDLVQVTDALGACTRDLDGGDEGNVLVHLLIDYTHGFVLSASSGDGAGLTTEDYLRGVDWVLERAAGD